MAGSAPSTRRVLVDTHDRAVDEISVTGDLALKALKMRALPLSRTSGCNPSCNVHSLSAGPPATPPPGLERNSPVRIMSRTLWIHSLVRTAER